MLITTCTQCLARFRVTPQQLNARQGQVRCGRCRTVFNGFEALERFPDDDTGARLLAAREADAGTTPAPAPVPLPEHQLPEVESVDSPAAEAPRFDPAPAPPRAAAPEAMDIPIDIPIDIPVDTPPPAPVERPRREKRPRVKPEPAVQAEPEITLEPPPRKPVSRAWSFGVVLLLLVLAVELAFAFRGPLAQRYPPVRPVLEAACGWIACTVPWGREEAMLKLEESEMLEVPGKPGEIALGARIRNLGSAAQEYPHLELTLTDLTGQPAARRVLRPTDYLGRPLQWGEVLAPGAEMALQLRLETRMRATGYELLLFYP